MWFILTVFSVIAQGSMHNSFRIIDQYLTESAVGCQRQYIIWAARFSSRASKISPSTVYQGLQIESLEVILETRPEKQRARLSGLPTYEVVVKLFGIVDSVSINRSDDMIPASVISIAFITLECRKIN